MLYSQMQCKRSFCNLEPVTQKIRVEGQRAVPPFDFGISHHSGRNSLLFGFFASVLSRVSNVGGEDKCFPLHSEGSLSTRFDRIGKRILGRATVELFPSQRGMHRDDETGVGSARSVVTAMLFFLLDTLGCKESLADGSLPVFGKTRINSSRSCEASSATVWSCLFSRERKTSLPSPLPHFQEWLLQGVALRLLTGVDLIYCFMVSGGRD